MFVDEPFVNSTALMRAPNGDVMTQFELHTAEKASLIKYDMLSVEAVDKIQICLNLLIEKGYVKQYDTLRETYEHALGIYNIERTDPKMWEMVYEQKIGSLFQMDAPSGKNAIKLTHPNSVDDLATINSVLRLMAQEKGGEMPLEKFARFKKNPDLWYKEMEEWGLTESEIKLLEPIAKGSYGITESQESFMQLVQIPECGGFNLTWADRLRKSIAKKNPKEFDKLTEEYFQNMKDKGLSEHLCNYVWKVLVAYSRGYGFNKSHTLAYSLIALQEMNLAYKYPIMFWNCACLISDAGGNGENDEECDGTEEKQEIEEFYSSSIEDFDDSADDSEDDSDTEEDEEDIKDVKKKKKTKAVSYGKIAAAIGKIKATGVEVSAPDINKSSFTFSPDIENNTIRYGFSGITRIGEDLIKDIINNRPYNSLEDFLLKVKVTKPQTINLIKSGAFDCFGDRMQIMHNYIDSISDIKKRITMQNVNMMIGYGLIPEQFDLQIRVFNFNKYLKKFNKGIKDIYNLDDIAFNFYSKHFDIDKLSNDKGNFYIKADVWDAIYAAQMDKLRPWVKNNATSLLTQVNNKITEDTWNKYCTGSTSKWEMDSISCYIHKHELEGINGSWDRFDKLSSQPEIDRIANFRGKSIPLYKIHRIAGTVLDRNKSKKTVSLLTSSGVVTVKIYGGEFAMYDRQISEKGVDGKKHVIQKSIFSRGNKIIVTGIREDDDFRAKKYKSTPYHLIEQIDYIDEEGSVHTSNREGQEE